MRLKEIFSKKIDSFVILILCLRGRKSVGKLHSFHVKCNSKAIEFLYFNNRKQEIHIHFTSNYPIERKCLWTLFGRFIFIFVWNFSFLSVNLFISVVNMYFARISLVALIIPLVCFAHEPSRESITSADYIVSKEDVNRTLFSWVFMWTRRMFWSGNFFQTLVNNSKQLKYYLNYQKIASSEQTMS